MHTSSTPPPRVRRGLWIGAAAAALALLPAMPAAAHDQLVAATPAAGSTVSSAVPAVDLTFDAAVLELGGGRNSIEVTGAGGRHFETACAAVDGTGMSVPVALGGAGAYTVSWRAVSNDGHPVGADYSFDYRPPAGLTAAAGAADSPCATAQAAPRATSGTGVQGALLTGAIAGALVLAAVAAVLVVVLRLRRREDEEARR